MPPLYILIHLRQRAAGGWRHVFRNNYLQLIPSISRNFCLALALKSHCRCDRPWMSIIATPTVLLCWGPFFDPGGPPKRSWGMPLTQVIIPPNPALESTLLATVRSHGASTAARWRPPGDCEDRSLPQASGLWALGETPTIYTTSLLRGICFVSRLGVYVCVCTFASWAPLYDQCCHKHPCIRAFRWMPLFPRNRFPGVGLLGQRAYVFLILMDFSRLISKMAVIIYISTSKD